MATLTPEQQAQFEILQELILWDDTSDNPNLQPSSIPTKHKALNTNNKNIIKAINEVLDEATNAFVMTNEFKDRMNNVVGDNITNPILMENLNKIEENILKAVVKTYTLLVGDLDSPVDISNFAPSVNEAILKLSETSETQNTLLEFNNYIEEIAVDAINPNILKLKFIPKTKSLTLIINGIKYDKEFFTISKYEKQVEWIFTANNGGFDIATDFDVKACYDLYYSENGIEDAVFFSKCMDADKEFEPLEILNDSILPNAVANQEYSATIETKGGTQPIMFMLHGSLPEGLSIYENSITGTPTSYGKYSFTIEAKDSKQPYFIDKKEFHLEINSGKPMDFDSFGEYIDESKGYVKFGSLLINSEAVDVPQEPHTNGDIIKYSATSTMTIGETVEGKELSWFKRTYSDKTVYICDRNLVNTFSFNNMNTSGWVLGKTVSINGKQFTARLMQYDAGEWSLLNDLASTEYHCGTIENPQGTMTKERKLVGLTQNTDLTSVSSISSNANYGFRPVLELIKE